jgi:ribose-phosphate pyrophosphokinase
MLSVFYDDGQIKYCPIESGSFPDGSLSLRVPIVKPLGIQWNYENDAELFTLICLRKHFSEYDLILRMPYIPHARMDRVKNEDEIFTLKYFAEIINSLNFTKVEVLDAHSNVSLALLNNVVEMDVKEHIQKAIDAINDDALVLCFPDEGSMKRYSSMFNMPYCFGVKKRDWRTGKIEGIRLINKDMVYSNNILIIDDICSRGGTFYHMGNALKVAGAGEIFLYVSHAESTMVTGDMYNQDVVSKIFTTDSIFINPIWDTRNKVIMV